MGILSGVVSYMFGLCLNLLDACIDGFLGALGFDLDAFESYFPAAKEYHDIIIGFAIGLLFIMLIFQIFRNFGVVLELEAEDPLKMLGKTALFLGMIIYSRSIVNFVIGLLVDPYAIFIGAASQPYEFKLSTIVTSMFGSIFSNPFMSIVALIMLLVLGWQFLKLTIECVERYVVFYFVLYCAPVVFATGAFKSTAQILKSWCRMLASQAILLLLNIWSIKLFMSFMPVFEQDADNLVFNFLLGLAFLKFAQKADTLLRILGLNTASTGDMVRSLGGTIASIAFAIKSAGNMAQNVGSAAGKIFGGGSSGGDGAAGDSGGGNGSGNGDVSGMSGHKGGSGGLGGPGGAAAGTESNPISGVTDSGINAAKQSYINDVLNSAKSQMQGIYGENADRGPGSGRSKSARGHAADFDSQGKQPEGFGRAAREDATKGGDGNIAMKPGKQPGDEGNVNPANVDMETKEGLNNLAHGLHHDQYNPEAKTYSGGGMPEFKGKDANLIGSSQLMPADGIHQTTMKMPDGTMGTVYSNNETGESHVVQFGSVDNGVIQGTISKLDPATGGAGEDFAFKAVHGSVPGAETFSSHSVPVSDGFGGTYHLATGGNTDIFAAPTDTVPQASGSSYTPGGASKMASPEVSAQPAAGHTQSGSFAGADGGSPDLAGTFSGGAPDNAAPGVHVHGVSQDESGAPGSGYSPGPVDAGISGTVHTGQAEGASTAAPQPVPAPDRTDPQHGNTPSATDNGTQSAFGGGQSVYNETPQPIHYDAENQPIGSGTRTPQNEVRRFSKDNPDNVEIFRREGSRLEQFEKSSDQAQSIPRMDQSNKK